MEIKSRDMRDICLFCKDILSYEQTQEIYE